MTALQRRRLHLLRQNFELSALCIEVAVRGREAEKLKGSPEEIVSYAAKGYEALEKLQSFTLTPEDESEIFIRPRRPRKGVQGTLLDQFKQFYIPGLLRPILDHGSLTAFNRVTDVLGKKKAQSFWSRFKTWEPLLHLLLSASAPPLMTSGTATPFISERLLSKAVC